MANPIDFTNLTVSSNVQKISSTHGLSRDLITSLDNAIQTAAVALQAIERGPMRKYGGPIDALYSQFAQHWKPGDGQEHWTKRSLAKATQQRVWNITHLSGTSTPSATKPASKKRRKRAHGDGSGQPSHKDTPVESTEFNAPVKLENSTSHAESHVNGARPPTNKRIRITSSKRHSLSDRSPLCKEEPTESRPESPSFALSFSNSDARRITASKSSISETTDAVRTIHPSEVVIVFVPTKPDPVGPPFLSLLLWRCQRPMDDGRDAPKEALVDYRDISYADFIRQLRKEKALSDDEFVVWGEFAQVVNSDLTFSGAIEEQVEAARAQGRPSKEVTFEAAVRPK